MAASPASLASGCGRSALCFHSTSARPLRQSLPPRRTRSLSTPFPRSGRVMCIFNRIPNPGSANDSKQVLDAFFLGKAFAEALNERIGSTVGEVLSVVGQWQAEQQKQIQDFQEEVFERAKKAKEKAALDAIGEKGVTSKPSSGPSNTLNGTSNTLNGTSNPDPKTDDLLDRLKD